MDGAKNEKSGVQGEVAPTRPVCDYTITKGPKKGVVCGVGISNRSKSAHLCARHFLCGGIK